MKSSKTAKLEKFLGVQPKEELVKYDITDIATNEEAEEIECNCILHSGGRQPLSGFGVFDIWSDWNDPLNEEKPLTPFFVNLSGKNGVE